MSDRVKAAIECLSKVPFPEMELGPGGTIWTKPTSNKPSMKVATLNLRAMTLPEAWAWGSAFIAAGEALSCPTAPDIAALSHATPQGKTPPTD